MLSEWWRHHHHVCTNPFKCSWKYLFVNLVKSHTDWAFTIRLVEMAILFTAGAPDTPSPNLGRVIKVPPWTAKLKCHKIWHFSTTAKLKIPWNAIFTKKILFASFGPKKCFRNFLKIGSSKLFDFWYEVRKWKNLSKMSFYFFLVIELFTFSNFCMKVENNRC